MARIVFVTGFIETGRDTIIDMVLKGSSKKLVGLKHVRFEDMGVSGLKSAIPGNIRKSRDQFYSKVERAASDAMKSGMSVVVEGPLTAKTENGYLPIVPRDFFDSFAPEIIILFEMPDGKDVDSLHQQINRAYAGTYASLAGCPLKIITVKKNGVKYALRDCTVVMENVLGR